MRRRRLLVAGLATLGAAWFVVPFLPFGDAFLGHMTMHVGVVALAAPLLAAGLAGTTTDPTRHLEIAFHPVTATAVEFVVVWGWHAPALHFLARTSPPAFALEQLSFLAVGLMVWLAAVGERNGSGRNAIPAGVGALFLTSMHMTLLGALLALAPRPLYDPAICGFGTLGALEDQQLGGVLMLLVGGASYLLGGLVLMARLLRVPEAAGQGGRT